jgi:hypothetical protein
MNSRLLMLVLAVLMVTNLGWANKKDKQELPNQVLRAGTVYVMIQPGTDEPISDPKANQKAVKAVEEAVMKWGRFRLAMTPDTADIIIAVQKGTAAAAVPTVGGGPVDSRPVIFNKTDDQVRIGAQTGQPPTSTSTMDPDAGDPRVHTGAQFGGAEDEFKVYLAGAKQNPLDVPPVWRYAGKDALRAPDVPAVEKFRKAVEESEKVAQKRQQTGQTQQTNPSKP